MDYQEYKYFFKKDIKENTIIFGSGNEAREFFDTAVSKLVEFDEIENPTKLEMKDTKCTHQRLMRADAYVFDQTDKSLCLFINDYVENDDEGLSPADVNALYWKLLYYLEETCNSTFENYLEKTEPAYKAAKLIQSRFLTQGRYDEEILKIKFYILTNKELNKSLFGKDLLEENPRRRKKTKKSKSGKAKNKKIKKPEFNGRPLEIIIWNIERFYELEEANRTEPVEIDFPEDFNYEGIPCIKGEIGENLGYEAYMAIIPGKVLADIYIEYGSKVLEGNVRAFLGTGNSRSVNSGIKKTINNDPTSFFTYNNGIAVTAAEAETVSVEGRLLITHIVDLQIINGGQTTATLAEAVLKKTNLDLTGIYVPMKLTVIKDRDTEDDDGILVYDKMVKNIATYANHQNKVTAADLFSNDPFHIWMEKASKKYLATKGVLSTGWYYERARKKYDQEQFKLKGEALKRFLIKYPKKQIINKEQLAVYLTAVNCRPDIVSKGKNWVFKEFGTVIAKEYKKDRALFNEYYFRKCVCAAIIFRTVDSYLTDNMRKPDFWYKPGGYKLNIVPYTVSKIISAIPKGYTLNWQQIWNTQSVSPAFMEEIKKVTVITNDFINQSRGMIVTEFCKRPDTWINYRDNVRYNLSDRFKSELVSIEEDKEKQKVAQKDQKDTNELLIIMDMVKAGAQYWDKLLNLGKQRKLLSNSEEVALYKIKEFVKKGLIPQGNNGKVPRKTMELVNIVIAIKEKLEAEGLASNQLPSFDDDYMSDVDVVQINITSNRKI